MASRSELQLGTGDALEPTLDFFTERLGAAPGCQDAADVLRHRLNTRAQSHCIPATSCVCCQWPPAAGTLPQTATRGRPRRVRRLSPVQHLSGRRPAHRGARLVSKFRFVARCVALVHCSRGLPVPCSVSAVAPILPQLLAAVANSANCFFWHGTPQVLTLDGMHGTPAPRTLTAVQSLVAHS